MRCHGMKRGSSAGMQALLLALSGGAAVAGLRGLLSSPWDTRASTDAAAFVPASMLGAAAPPAAAAVSETLGGADLPQLLMAATPVPAADLPSLEKAQQNILFPDFRNMEFMSNENITAGPDMFFYIFPAFMAVVIFIALYFGSKEWWENRWLVGRINKQKLKFITSESTTTPKDRYELGRMYSQLRDYPAALAEFDEVEEDWYLMRSQLNPEDTMGALASRAMLHNSKGYGLSMLEPARPAAARREFVRAITFWPEYPEALLNIGQELIKRKRYDVAIRTLNQALRWQPANEYILEAADVAQRKLDEIQMMEEDGFIR